MMEEPWACVLPPGEAVAPEELEVGDAVVGETGEPVTVLGVRDGVLRVRGEFGEIEEIDVPIDVLVWRLLAGGSAEG
jgi:hypothetical protein